MTCTECNQPMTETRRETAGEMVWIEYWCEGCGRNQLDEVGNVTNAMLERLVDES